MIYRANSREGLEELRAAQIEMYHASFARAPRGRGSSARVGPRSAGRPEAHLRKEGLFPPIKGYILGQGGAGPRAHEINCGKAPLPPTYARGKKAVPTAERIRIAKGGALGAPKTQWGGAIYPYHPRYFPFGVRRIPGAESTNHACIFEWMRHGYRACAAPPPLQGGASASTRCRRLVLGTTAFYLTSSAAAPYGGSPHLRAF